MPTPPREPPGQERCGCRVKVQRREGPGFSLLGVCCLHHAFCFLILGLSGNFQRFHVLCSFVICLSVKRETERESLYFLSLSQLVCETQFTGMLAFIDPLYFQSRKLETQRLFCTRHIVQTI